MHDEQNRCTCACHHEGTTLLHVRPCCQLCYQHYMTLQEGQWVIDEAKYTKLLASNGIAFQLDETQLIENYNNQVNAYLNDWRRNEGFMRIIEHGVGVRDGENDNFRRTIASFNALAWTSNPQLLKAVRSKRFVIQLSQPGFANAVPFMVDQWATLYYGEVARLYSRVVDEIEKIHGVRDNLLAPPEAYEGDSDILRFVDTLMKIEPDQRSLVHRVLGEKVVKFKKGTLEESEEEYLQFFSGELAVVCNELEAKYAMVTQ